MLPTISIPDDATLRWSPHGSQLAYAHTSGLHIYVMGEQNDRCEHLFLREGAFIELHWSPNGKALSARRDDGRWFVYGSCHAATPELWLTMRASSIEWLDDNHLLYVPDEGGLVMVTLSERHHHMLLTG